MAKTRPVFVADQLTKDTIFPPFALGTDGTCEECDDGVLPEEAQKIFDVIKFGPKTPDHDPSPRPYYYAQRVPETDQCAIMHGGEGSAVHLPLAVVSGSEPYRGTPLAIVNALNRAYTLGQLHAYRKKDQMQQEELKVHRDAITQALKGSEQLLRANEFLKKENRQIKKQLGAKGKKKAAP